MATDRRGRKDRLLKQKRHDVYLEQGKLPESTLCTECNALYINGRWSWKECKQSAKEVVCPACKRIADRYPAGYIEIKGPFFQERRKEILALVKNVEKREKDEHPLERIISVTDEKDHVLITTTGVHIARRIGEVLSRSYKGDFSLQYAGDEERIRVSWMR